MNKSSKLAKFLIRTFLLIFAVIQIFPLYWLFMFSFKSNKEIFGGNIIGLPKEWLWENYRIAASGGDLLSYFSNSILVTTVTVILTITLATMASYAITRLKWKLSKTVLNFFLLGIMIPLHAALLPLFLVLRNLNILNTYFALIIPYSAFNLPIAIFIFTGFFETIPREMEESALIDGCNIYKMFSKIMIPLMKPAIATVAIFIYLATWNELMFAVIFINKQKFMTLPVGMMSLVSKYRTEWGPIGASLVFAVLPSIIIYMILSKRVQESIRAGAIKG